jgi:hypothetical protein
MAAKKAATKSKAPAKKAPAAKAPAKTASTKRAEDIGDKIDVFTAPHPPRKDSPEYGRSRKWLMGKASGGCYICGGPVDLSHPEDPANAKGLQDHHGGGLYKDTVLIGFNLFPLEWSMGFGADPKKIAAFVGQLVAAGLVEYDKPLQTTDDVMAWVDSTLNANVKLCAPHHIGHQSQHTPDINGHEAVGIHNAPWPILAAQATCDWQRFDMWAGTTGTIAVAPDPETKGGTIVHYVHESHPVKAKVGEKLPPSHPHSRAAHNGFRKK